MRDDTSWEAQVVIKNGRSDAATWRFFGAMVLTAAALLVSSPVAAGLCASTTGCSLVLDAGNTGSGFGTGDFGTVSLSLSGNTVHVTVSLASGFYIIGTGFPGSFGFSDSLGGGLTIDNFSSGAYSGALSHATNDLHFDGFGFFNDAAATTAPSPGSVSALSTVSFDVSGADLTDVNQLVNFANPAGGDGAVVFVVDAINRNTSGAGAGNTGLIGATGISRRDAPEPASLALMVAGLAGLAVVRRRSGIRQAA